MNDSRFDDGADRLHRAISRIEVQAAVLTRNFELLNRRRPHGDELDRAEYLLLRTLDSLGPATIGVLADALGLDPSTVGRQVSVLEQAGLGRRTPDPADRRRAIVSATARGRRQMRRTAENRSRRTRDMLGDWSQEDLETLGQMFTRYNRAVAERYLGDDRTP